MTVLAPPAALSGATWRALEAAHRARADALTAAHRERARRGEKHPIEDFLFTYYSYKPAVLRAWHPGVGVELDDAAERAQKRWYTCGATPGSARVDAAAFHAEKATRDIRYLDMQASPYDMREWAGDPVRIETAEGKAEYVRRQRGFSERANALRHRLLACVE